MFNLNTNLVKGYTSRNLKRVFFFSRSNNRIVNRFINFTFGGSNPRNRRLVNFTYNKLINSLNFTSRKTVVKFNLDSNLSIRQFNWLFLYKWHVKLQIRSCKIRYRIGKFSILGYKFTLMSYVYKPYKYKNIDHSLNTYGMDLDRISHRLDFLDFSALVYNRKSKGSPALIYSNKINYKYWKPYLVNRIIKIGMYRCDQPFKITRPMYKQLYYNYKYYSSNSPYLLSKFENFNRISNSLDLFIIRKKKLIRMYKRNRLLKKFVIAFKLFNLYNSISSFSYLVNGPIGPFLRGNLLGNSVNVSLISDEYIIYTRLFYSKKFSFFDMIPNRYIHNLLISYDVL